MFRKDEKSQKFKNMSQEERNTITATIELNNKMECEAREFYYQLLNTVADEHKPVIKEIICDEIDHSIKLMRLAEVYSGNKPTEYESILDLTKVKGE